MFLLKPVNAYCSMYAYADYFVVVIHYTYIESIEDGGTNKSYTYMYVKIDKKSAIFLRDVGDL